MHDKTVPANPATPPRRPRAAPLLTRRPSLKGVALVALLGTAGWGLSSSPLGAGTVKDVVQEVSSHTSEAATASDAAPEIPDARIVALRELQVAEAERLILSQRAAARALASQRAATAARAARTKARTALISNAKTNPQSAAKAMLADFGWGAQQMPCLVTLWQGESAWHWNAENRSSGAYGIPQALPGSKMASSGSDWRSNPVTQIRWGMTYISKTYGSPCSALSRWNSRSPHWY